MGQMESRYDDRLEGREVSLGSSAVGNWSDRATSRKAFCEGSRLNDWITVSTDWKAYRCESKARRRVDSCAVQTEYLDEKVSSNNAG